MNKIFLTKNAGACIPQRWIVATMGFFAFFNAYTLRICLSIAITKMAAPINSTEKSSVDESCPSYSDDVVNATSHVYGQTFEWSEYTQGIILSSFYWGYAMTHLPGGLLAAKFGPKRTLGAGLLITALLTLLTPKATIWGDATALIAIRFTMGLCEGVIQPSMSCLLARWIPADERSVTASLVYTGVRFGILISSVVSGLIMANIDNNWSDVFYLFGVIGVFWFVFWIFLCYNSPKDHPFITDKEKQYLNEKMAKHSHQKIPAFPWKYALTSKPFLALIVMQSGQDWSNYTIMSDLPKYMHNVLRLPIHLNGYASSMHNITSWIFCMLMSYISDWLFAKGYATSTQIRKINATIASLGPAVMLISAMYVGCDVITAVSLITIGLTLSGSSIPGIKVNVMDLSPNYAGTLMGISNGIGAICGILAPYTVGVLAPNQTLSEWRLIFWIVAIVYFVTTVNFIIFASGEVQQWNDPIYLIDKLKTPTGKQQENVDLLKVTNSACV